MKLFVLKNTSKKEAAYFVLIALCFLFVLTGWAVPIMEIDAAQYANMSREMLQSKSYLQVYDLGQNYLDKPPMLFWLSAVSMKLFGVNSVAYRLPSFCFSILAVYSCYKLCLLFYKKEIACISAVVLASCQAMFLINHDVRTDTMLMGWVALSIWQLAAWYHTNKWKHFLLAAVAIAGGMLTKGPIALMVPAFAFAPHFILNRQWKQFFKWQYLLLVLIIAILLLPMLYGLYWQYDVHGQQGIWFFLWTQSFGRITGENSWHEYSKPYFLYQNMLWSFLPWIVFFSTAIILECKNIFKQKFRLETSQEWITTGGFLLTYCALASSKAQLPHYIFVVYPLAAIVTAKFLYAIFIEKKYSLLTKWLQGFHYGLLALLLVGIVFIIQWSFNQNMRPLPFWVNAITVFFTISSVASHRFKKLPDCLVFCIITMLWANLLVNFYFYPPLLQYQPGVAINQFITTQKLNKNNIATYQFTEGRSLPFYANHQFKKINDWQQVGQGQYVLLYKKQWDSLPQSGYQIVDSGQAFAVSKLSLKFLNPATRLKETTGYLMVKKL